MVTNNTCITWTLPAHTTGGGTRLQSYTTLTQLTGSLSKPTAQHTRRRLPSLWPSLIPRRNTSSPIREGLVGTMSWGGPPRLPGAYSNLAVHTDPTPRNLIWAPSHQGLQGNEQADQAARALSPRAVSLSLEAYSQSDNLVHSKTSPITTWRSISATRPFVRD